MNSRLPPLSTTERQKVVDALASGVRLDGRSLLENRDVSIQFGKDFGSCTVSLGDTRVSAKVSCEVVEPRPSRPNEGKIMTSVHVTSMAGPEYETGRTNDTQDELQQLLDNNIKESRCLDLEALCIMAEESVWQFRVDVTVLNACGNLGDACNMAAVAALKHFHRPDVTVEEDGRVTIHSFAEREPIPTFLKKVPVCLTYAFCEQEEDELIVFCDPTDLEERVVRGRLVVGLNPHGEITSMNFPGPVMLDKKHITFCIGNAFERARQCAKLVDNLVENDLKRRTSDLSGFVGQLTSDIKYKKDRIDSKVCMMEAMSDQLQKVREMIDQTKIKEEVDLPLDDEIMDHENLIDSPKPSTEGQSPDSSSSSSTDSEFSDAENDSLVPNAGPVSRNESASSKKSIVVKTDCD